MSNKRITFVIQKQIIMKTKIPDSIKTIEESKTFLTDLYNNGESFHPEDDANDCIGHIATLEEGNKINDLMADIYNLPGNDGKHDNSIIFCPCEFLLNLDPEYSKMRQEDEAEYLQSK